MKRIRGFEAASQGIRVSYRNLILSQLHQHERHTLKAILAELAVVSGHEAMLEKAISSISAVKIANPRP